MLLAAPRVLLLAALVSVRSTWATECPNCELQFPTSWQQSEQPWGLQVTAEGEQIAVKIQPDAVTEPLGPGDVADELVWLKAETAQDGLTISEENGRILRTVSTEPAVLLDYHWVDATGGSGQGFRLVRRCGVRLIFELRGAEPKLDAIIRVSERVRYSLPECVKNNADVIPLEVLEGPDRVMVAPAGSDVEQGVEVPSPAPSGEGPGISAEQPPAPLPGPEAVPSEEPGSSGSHLLLFVGAAALGLLALLVLMLRSGSKAPLEAVPPIRGPRSREASASAAQPAGEHSAFPAAPAPPPPPTTPAGEGAAADDDELGDENTDAILPTGTYGLRGAGGGERAEHIALPAEEEIDGREPSYPGSIPEKPPEAAASVPSHAVVSYADSLVRRAAPGAGKLPREGGDESFEDDSFAISPVEAALATLGITTWLDFTAPGVHGVAFLPSSIAELLQVQNGGRLGYGWLLLLGLRRKNMDIMTLNGDPRVKSRFGEGWLVGVFAFGNVLWVGPDQVWEIRTLEGGRIHLGEGPEEALRGLAHNPALRDHGAPIGLVERSRNAVGELLPGWVYVQVPEPSVLPDDARHGLPAYEPVQIIPFLELLQRVSR
ncbi:MAG: hypothetical protein ABIO70_31635 [Pseudomonadota bacterium]